MSHTGTPQNKPGLWQIISSVLAAGFGVQCHSGNTGHDSIYCHAIVHCEPDRLGQSQHAIHAGGVILLPLLVVTHLYTPSDSPGTAIRQMA